MRSNRIITEEQKWGDSESFGIPSRAIYDFMARSGGGYTKIGFLRKDLKHYLFLSNKRAMGPGEATVLQSWFRKQVSRNGFYYYIQVDSDGAICSIFWPDSIMRADYALFGDFVSFDTTYQTNKSYKPLGIFIGFNHHKITCVFGGALLYDESAATYKWLLKTFLKFMKWKKPVIFMTDQAPAIAVGVRQIFKGVFHALCSWHIKKNAIKKLGASTTSKFLDQFKHLVKHVDDEDQFEYTWSLIQEKFFANRRRSDISWLTFIYNSRKQWSSAWVKDNFMAGKRTTQLSEQFNAFARLYLKPEQSITQLLNRFQDLIDDLRHNELMFDFIM
ncbi:hypothetical protein LIER_41065 [Lithospermum erythrorhizon]|uniref:MULE transposase domain-containing protein n=1 Tax=Lithospermum erythrorhizon TaxID=34254 RepID=A0AAV3R546_LITER